MAEQKLVLEITINEVMLTGEDVNRELQRLGRRLAKHNAEHWNAKSGLIITGNGHRVGNWRLVEAEREAFVLDVTPDERQYFAKAALKRAEAIEEFASAPALWPKQAERALRWREVSYNLDPATDPPAPTQE